MLIGIQTRPWGPEKNRHHLSEVLADVALAGYDGIEIGAQHLDLARPADLAELLNQHRLRAAAIHVGGDLDNAPDLEAALPRLEQAVAYAAHVGATFLTLSGKDKTRTPEAFRFQADSLNRIGRLCCQHGLRLAYHNHNWELSNHCRELHLLCEHTDASLVSLCLDVAWVHRAGESPPQVVNAFLHRIAYLHVKDTTASEWKELGSGDVDLTGVLREIAGVTLPWLVVEQDETTRTPLASARISRDYMRREWKV